MYKKSLGQNSRHVMSADSEVQKLEPLALLLGRKMCSHFGKQCQVLKRLNTECPYGPAFPLLCMSLGMCPSEMKTWRHKNLHTNVHSSILYNRLKVETPQILSAGKWVKQMPCIHRPEYYLTIKKHEVLI